VTEDPRLTAMMPDRRPSRVTLTMNDGSTHEAETFVNRGDYEDPYSAEDLKAKFGALAEPVWGNRAAWELYDGVMRLDQIPAVNDLTAILRQKEA
jgi:2-methylcitrate dehydratase PrpD